MYTKKIPLGHRFGTRTVVEELAQRKNGYIMYRVMCDCGDIITLNGSYLRCRCRPCKSCSAKANTKKGKEHYAYKHGMAARTKGRDRIYSIWVSMRQRCNDSNDRLYSAYGGRGIKVCSEWDDFTVFYNDMGERPAGMQIDRIDNEKGYCKENCRWADKFTQANNKRTTRIHTIDGKPVKHTDLLKTLNLSRDTAKGIEKRKSLKVLYEAYSKSKKL